MKKKIIILITLLMGTMAIYSLGVNSSKRPIDTGISDLYCQIVETRTAQDEWLMDSDEYQFRSASNKYADIVIDMDKSIFKNCRAAYTWTSASSDGQWSFNGLTIKAIDHASWEYVIYYIVKWKNGATYTSYFINKIYGDSIINKRKLEKEWLYDNKSCFVQQDGDSLTFINENGSSSSGYFINDNTVVATTWGNLYGDLINGNKEIHWRNETTWISKNSIINTDIVGKWYYNSRLCSISQDGTKLIFVNEKGDESPGYFIDSKTVVATKWGNLYGDILQSGKEIRWRNNTIWTK